MSFSVCLLQNSHWQEIQRPNVTLVNDVLILIKVEQLLWQSRYWTNEFPWTGHCNAQMMRKSLCEAAWVIRFSFEFGGMAGDGNGCVEHMDVI